MGLFLKQSTAVTVQIGPFVDSTDGNTEESALTISQADVRLSKNGGNIAQKNEATSCTYDEVGMYSCPLDATDTDTLGVLQLIVHESGALPVYHEYMVVTANVWDTLCSTDLFQSDLTQIGGVAQSATDLKDLADTGYDSATHKVQGVVLCDNTTTNTDMVTDVSANVTSILADTNELQTDWANGGRLDLLVDAIKAITDLLTLAAIADAVHDEVTEGTTTLRQSIKLISSALFAKTSGGGTATLVARDVGDTKDRITLTVDADGNRTASTLDGT